MPDPKGFLKYTKRETPQRRPVPLRLLDWKEVYEDFSHDVLRDQAARCMDCGIPFCHNGCPLGNLIPEWNDLVRTDRWRDAIERLHATNNFPEFTGRLCPAPCEGSCVLGINQDPVTIKQVEVEIIDNAFDEGWVVPLPPEKLTGKKVAVVGSGPAGLAAAQQLTRAGHSVTVFERDDRIGGLLRYGIPEFKMEKRHIDRRLAQMESEGTVFRAGVNVGIDITAAQLRSEFDAVVLAGGATAWRDLPIAGRDLDGIHQAMEFLPWANRVQNGDPVVDDDGLPPIHAKGKKVIIIGGGDTGADCLGTVAPAGRRQRAPVRDHAAPAGDPRGLHPVAGLSADVPGVLGARGGRRARLLRQHRGVRRQRRARHRAARARGRHERGQVREESRARDFELEADLVLLAMGFVGPERDGLLTDLGVEINRAWQRRTGRGLRDHRARRVRRRRHGPGAVADRVGNRRGPRSRGRCGPLPDGSDRPSCADQAHRRSAALTCALNWPPPAPLHTVRHGYRRAADVFRQRHLQVVD